MNEAASLPTLEICEQAILDTFAKRGIRPGKGIQSLDLLELTIGNPPPFRATELNAALDSLQKKGCIDTVTRPGTTILLEARRRE